MKNISIDACFSPHLYSVYKDEESIVVIIDIFRATSAICTAFEHGAEKMIPVATIDEARQWKEKGYLVTSKKDMICCACFRMISSGCEVFDVTTFHTVQKVTLGVR